MSEGAKNSEFLWSFHNWWALKCETPQNTIPWNHLSNTVAFWFTEFLIHGAQDFLVSDHCKSRFLLKLVFSPRFLETLGCSYNIMHNSHVYDMIYYFCELEFFFVLGAPLTCLISQIRLLFQVGWLMSNPPRKEMTRVWVFGFTSHYIYVHIFCDEISWCNTGMIKVKFIFGQ